MKNFWADKSVLITGGAGYLACNLLNLLKDRTAAIVRLDRPGADFSPACGKADTRNVQADIRDSGIWRKLVPDADVIFHLAAQTSAAGADADPIADMAVNVTPMVALLDACRRTGAAPVIVFAGTATECGLTASLPVSETVPDCPVTAYDLNKWMAEKYLEYEDAHGAMRGATLRLANLYGPGPRSSSADRGVLNRMIRRALAGEPLTVYGHGNYLRDYLFAEDAARAFVLAAEHMETLHGGHYLLGTGTGHTIRKALEMVAERTAAATGAPPVAVETVEPPVPLTPIETRNFVADSSLFRTRAGWCAEVDLREGIDRTVAFYRGATIP